MIDESKYDAILCVTEPVNETLADRRMGDTVSKGKINPAWGSQTGYLDYLTPDITAAFSFGRTVKRAIEDSDLAVEVADFGPWITVKCTATNTATGRTASKTFLIVFQHKSRGIVMSTSNKWRTIDGYSQAASYIKSACSSLRSACDSVI